mmetsp:Transcript_44071/g.127454  ORF Transcript_44071/g.127454 Transcript_44071/m.127454 type:complete len:247 (-) Transcript_44071:1702-2442(-)
MAGRLRRLDPFGVNLPSSGVALPLLLVLSAESMMSFTVFMLLAAMRTELSELSKERMRFSRRPILSWFWLATSIAVSMLSESRATKFEHVFSASPVSSSVPWMLSWLSSTRWANLRQERVALLASCMTVSTSMDLLGPCSRRQPLRNSWNEISPVSSMSSRLNRYWASAGCTPMALHSAATFRSVSRSSIWLSEIRSDSLCWPTLLKSLSTWSIMKASSSSLALWRAVCTNTPVTTFIRASRANAM